MGYGYLIHYTHFTTINQPLFNINAKDINTIPLNMLNGIKHYNYRIYKTYSTPAKP